MNDTHPATAKREQAKTMTANALDPKHFVLLRIAKLRWLKARRIGEGVYAVPSHTRKRDGIEWVVTLTTCGCPSRGYCTHLATAVDFHFISEAGPADYTQYTNALIEDRYQLRLRIRANETTRNDRVYLRFCERFYRDKPAKVEAAKARPVRRVESRGKVREFVGPYQV